MDSRLRGNDRKNIMLQLVKAPDNKLRVKTRPVKKITGGHLQTIKEMIKLTKTFMDPEGVGLASTQVGLDEQFFVSKKEDGTFRAYFNPKVIAFSKTSKKMVEGCLSIPNYWGEIVRPIAVTVEYLNEKGEKVQEKLTGLEAHVFQHECDHLEGKLFMDKVLEQKARLFKVVGRDRTGSEVVEEVAL